MSAQIKPDELIALTDRIDDISTRLIVDGASAIGRRDFEALGQMAANQQQDAVAELARSIAEGMEQTSDLPDAEKMRLLSSHLAGLRGRVVCRDVQTQESCEATPTEPAENVISLAADHDLVREFITEAGEHLSNIEGQMLILETDHAAAEPLNAVFRAFHTIKGLAGFLELAPLQALAHEVETLLDMARNARLAVSPSVVDVVLESTDAIRLELVRIAQEIDGKEPPPSNIDQTILQRIRDAASRAELLDNPPSSPAWLATTLQPIELELSTPRNAPDNLPDRLTSTISTPCLVPAKVEIEPSKSPDATSVRINTDKLDQLMDMVGEMVIAQTLIGHSPILKAVKDPRLLSDLTQLARITADVQRITTGMRMVPIGLQFRKTARLVRDLSRRAGKQIVLETSGEETEVDKTIAEEISDPLLHMVRNSIDHGIESPEERVALGKDPVARIRVAAYHQSGQIVVAVSDDGRGLNRAKILAKAQQQGLIHDGEQLADNEVFLLIFEPGFTTTDKVTDISGRGVGMDVVRRHVQKLRGRIDLQSKLGQGTTFYLKLPLTLAIIEGLVVVVGAQRYVVPIFSIREMFRPKPGLLSTVQGTREMVMVRGGLLPVIRLHQRFHVQPGTADLTQGTLLVAESEGRQFCLFVDDVIGKQEVVIKSLGPSFKNIIGIAGCTILGDGRVGLILDIDGIYKGRV